MVERIKLNDTKRACNSFTHRSIIISELYRIPLKILNYSEMKRACKSLCTQEDDYKRVPYDAFKNKQL